jgi:hypothetical protein
MDNNNEKITLENLLPLNLGSGKTIMMQHMLSELGKKEHIKDIIKSCFNEKSINLSNEELEIFSITEGLIVYMNRLIKNYLYWK